MHAGAGGQGGGQGMENPALTVVARERFVREARV
jgi:hypothetical protein